MAKQYVGIFQTVLWDTPDGALGADYYGVVPGVTGIEGVEVFFLETQEKDKKQTVIGDLMPVFNADDIKGKTLANPLGTRVLCDFYDDATGVFFRQTETDEKFERIKTRKSEPPPDSKTIQAQATRGLP